MDGIGKNYADIPFAELKDIITNDKVLTAMSIAWKLGGETDELMVPLRKIRWRPSNTVDYGVYAGGIGLGKNGPESLEAFFSLIERVAKLTGGGKGKIDDEALDGLKKVIKELGLNGSETVARNKAKGAAETIALILNKTADGHTIKRIEARSDILLPDGVTRRRYYDVEIEIDGVIVKYEVKAWVPKNIKEYLFKQFKGQKVEDELTQIRTDLVKAMEESLVDGSIKNVDKITHRLLFDARVGDGVTKQDIIDDFLDKLEAEPTLLESFIKQTKNEKLINRLDMEEEKEKLIGELGKLLDKYIEINKKVSI